MKVIIDVDSSVSVEDALRAVARVCAEGHMSYLDRKCGRIGHFCWVTRFGDGIEVQARAKKSNQSADSFVVLRSSPNSHPTPDASNASECDREGE